MDPKVLQEIPPWDWPENADEMFLEILSDSQADTAERIVAAELASNGTVINGPLVDALLSILQSGDEPEELRGQAAIALGPVLDYADVEGLDGLGDVLISEDTFHRIQESLHRLYLDASVPKDVRRRILEASIRVPQDWHADAVRTAYASDDEDWRLTAVFSMRWVRGFDDQILKALESDNQAIQFEAICAAGNWEVDAAWAHVSRLVHEKDTDKALLLAAIDAVASIRPREAGMLLVDLTSSDDEDIVEAAYEAISMAEGASDGDVDDDDLYDY